VEDKKGKLFNMGEILKYVERTYTIRQTIMKRRANQCKDRAFLFFGLNFFNTVDLASSLFSIDLSYELEKIAILPLQLSVQASNPILCQLS
jgi:hypothetical protein